MNEEQNSSSIDPELEVRIVAMVLGEASDAEREQLDQMIALNPELLPFQLEIQNVHNLLHDVATVEPVDANESVEKPDDWKLSANRRSALLASIGDEPARLPDRRLAVNPADHEGLDHGHSKQRRLLQTILKVAAVLCVATFFGSLWTRINQTQMARRGSSLSSDIDIAEGTPWNRVAEGMALAETNAPAAP